MAYHKLKDQQDEIIKRYLAGESTVTLAKHYNCDHKAIAYYLNKNNIQKRDQSYTNRRFKCNETFFDEIDTEEKAYFLGFLYADGYNDEGKNQVSLSLQARDKAILEQLSNLIFENKSLNFIPRHKNALNSQHQYRLLICNKHMSKILAKHGMVQKKSLILQWPNNTIPNHLIRHFMRGLFDGDGCILNGSKQNSPTIGLVGSFNICSMFREYIRLLCPTYKANVKIHTQHKVFNVAFHSKTATKEIYDIFYKDSTIFLERKKVRFENYLKLKYPFTFNPHAL